MVACMGSGATGPKPSRAGESENAALRIPREGARLGELCIGPGTDYGAGNLRNCVTVAVRIRASHEAANLGLADQSGCTGWLTPGLAGVRVRTRAVRLGKHSPHHNKVRQDGSAFAL